MKKQFSKYLMLSSVVIATLFMLCSCATLPKMAECTDIPAYGDAPAMCKTPIKCGIMVSNEYMDEVSISYGQGKYKQTLSQQLTKDQLTAWLSDEVLKTGVSIDLASYDKYITRRDRLSLDKIIRVVSVDPRYQMASDGVLTDVRIGVEVHNCGEQETINRFDVWGRHVGQARQHKASFDLAIKDAFTNLVTLPEFAGALETPAQ